MSHGEAGFARAFASLHTTRRLLEAGKLGAARRLCERVEWGLAAAGHLEEAARVGEVHALLVAIDALDE